jgi:hypothetical protein
MLGVHLISCRSPLIYGGGKNEDKNTDHDGQFKTKYSSTGTTKQFGKQRAGSENL